MQADHILSFCRGELALTALCLTALALVVGSVTLQRLSGSAPLCALLFSWHPLLLRCRILHTTVHEHILMSAWQPGIQPDHP